MFLAQELRTKRNSLNVSFNETRYHFVLSATEVDFDEEYVEEWFNKIGEV